MMEHRLHATLHLTCDVCGQPALIVVGGVGGQWVFHDGCASPKVTMLTDNPKPLGVVTAIDDPPPTEAA